MFNTLLGVMVTLGFSSKDASTAWYSDYARACAEATSSDKPLFIVICSGSSEYHEMASLGVFFSDKLEKTLQSDYVRLFIDSDSECGKAIAEKFEATDDTPHFVILDRTARWQVFYKSGYLLEDDLVRVLKQFKRSKLSANGKPIRQVAHYAVTQACST
jgi:hypothetical protein